MNGSKQQPAEVISRPLPEHPLEEMPTPQSPLFVTGEEFLQVTIVCPVFFAGATLVYTARLLRRDGTITPISKSVTLASASTTDLLKLAEGYLLNVNVMISQPVAFSRGGAWVRVNIGRGSFLLADVRATLLQEYVTQQYMAVWPGASMQHPGEGSGNLRTIAGTDPAAGAEISETVPTNARWRLRGFRAALVTGAAVANRIVTIVVMDGSASFRMFSAGIAQTASLTTNHVLGAGAPGVAIGTTFMTHPFNDDVLLMPGQTIATLTGSIQAADNWGAPVIVVEEYVYL